MHSWQIRVAVERDELEVRIAKAKAQCDKVHDELLWRQVNVMQEYLDILDQRMAQWT